MSERSAVQDPLLKYANEIGWTRVSRSEAMQMRGGNTARALFYRSAESTTTQTQQRNRRRLQLR